MVCRDHCFSWLWTTILIWTIVAEAFVPVPPVKQCPVRVYGLQGHSSYLAIDLPDEMLQEGEVFGYQEKFYQVCSVLKDSEDHFCLNVNSIVETL